MNRIVISTALMAVSLFSTLVIAQPKAMITHNESNATTNAFVDEIPAPNPTLPHTTTQVPWFIVKTGCSQYTTEGVCPAVIKMHIDSETPVIVGTFYVNLTTGIITPSQIFANGFIAHVNGPGEITVSMIANTL